MKLNRICPLFLLVAAGCGEQQKVVNQVQVNQPINQPAENSKEEDSFADFNADNFVDGVNNPFFSLTPGRKFFYDGVDPYGIKIHKEVVATDQKREIAGVQALGTWVREWHDNSLVEDSKEWYAQDKDGNVWQLGQKEQNLFGGYLKGINTEWFHGENNAKAGIIVPGAPKQGETFSSAYNGLNEEKAEVIGIGESVTVPRGELKNCLQISEYSLGEKPKKEQSYYCKETATLSASLVPDTFGKVELTRIEDNHFESSDINYPILKINLSEDRAKEIALKKVSNSSSVSSINLTLHNDEPAYSIDVLDIDKNAFRVFLDVKSGKFLGSEKIKS